MAGSEIFCDGSGHGTMRRSLGRRVCRFGDYKKKELGQNQAHWDGAAMDSTNGGRETTYLSQSLGGIESCRSHDEVPRPSNDRPTLRHDENLLTHGTWVRACWTLSIPYPSPHPNLLSHNPRVGVYPSHTPPHLALLKFNKIGNHEAKMQNPPINY